MNCLIPFWPRFTRIGAFYVFKAMTPLFNKLNLKDHREIVVLDAPESFEPELTVLEGVSILREAEAPVRWALVFVQTTEDLHRMAERMAPLTEGDVVLWFAYPKMSSKRYRSELGRDSEAWNVLGNAGFEGVRAVAIDEDWSALRFRRVEYIRKMVRSEKLAATAEGKRRIAARREAGGANES